MTDTFLYVFMCYNALLFLLIYNNFYSLLLSLKMLLLLIFMLLATAIVDQILCWVNENCACWYVHGYMPIYMHALQSSFSLLGFVLCHMHARYLGPLYTNSCTSIIWLVWIIFEIFDMLNSYHFSTNLPWTCSSSRRGMCT